jgi:phage major head subunit gpT-like protein
MAIVTNALLTSLKTGFKGEFQRVYGETPSDFEQIATVVPSSTSSNTYGWLGQFPQLREWIGDRVLKDMKEHGYAIENKLYESTVGVARTSIEDDQLGIYKPLFGEMGRAAKVVPDELSFGLLKNGAATRCFDGQNFFDADHPVFPNVDGTGAAKTVSNLDGGDGPAWYLLDNSRVLKAVIFQERTKPELQALTSPDDEVVFIRDEYRYGVRYRCNVGFAFWQLAYCSRKPLTDANFNAAYDAMAAFTADGGRPLGIRPTHLVVPTNLRTAAQEICVSARKANGADNTNAGLVKTIITPWLN